MAKHHERGFDEIMDLEIEDQAPRTLTPVAPGEEEIRGLAYWIYRHRLMNAVPGTAEGDWGLAEAVLRDLVVWDFAPVP